MSVTDEWGWDLAEALHDARAAREERDTAQQERDAAVARAEKAEAEVAEIGAALDREHGFVKRLEAKVARVRAQVAEEIAADIEAELVCCDVYERDHGSRRAGTKHPICFWGAAAAIIAREHATEVPDAP